MTKHLRWIILLVELALAMSLTWPAAAAQPPEPLPQGEGPSRPVVHGVMFWMSGCGHCERVLNDILPPLQQQYGEQLDILLIEVRTSADVQKLLEIGASFDLTREQTGVPFLIIGERVLVGDLSIEQELPAFIREGLAAGGIDYPSNPLLSPYLPTTSAEEAVQCAPATPCVTPASAVALPLVETVPQAEPQAAAVDNDLVAGLILAVVVSAMMLGSLVLTAVVFMRAYGGQPLTLEAPWVRWAIPLLCVVGLLVAGYLTIIEYSGTTPYCGPVHGCDKVQSSKYAWVIKDVLPVGLLGVAGYVAILAAWWWGHFRRDMLARNAPLALFGMTLFGTLYSIYLTYLELFVIKAACIWCLINAAIVTALLVFSLPSASKMIAVAEGTDEADEEGETASEPL